MKIYNIKNVYREAFTQNLIELVNVDESCEIYFSSKLFRNLIDGKIMQTKIKYHEDKDVLVTKCSTYVDIPMLQRDSEVAITSFYMPVTVISVYRNCKLIKEFVNIRSLEV